MFLTLAPSVTVSMHTYQDKIVSSNSLTKIHPVLMFNSFSRTTLLMLLEVCYLVVQ